MNKQYKMTAFFLAAICFLTSLFILDKIIQHPQSSIRYQEDTEHRITDNYVNDISSELVPLRNVRVSGGGERKLRNSSFLKISLLLLFCVNSVICRIITALFWALDSLYSLVIVSCCMVLIVYIQSKDGKKRHSMILND